MFVSLHYLWRFGIWNPEQMKKELSKRLREKLNTRESMTRLRVPNHPLGHPSEDDVAVAINPLTKDQSTGQVHNQNCNHIGLCCYWTHSSLVVFTTSSTPNKLL